MANELLTAVRAGDGRPGNAHNITLWDQPWVGGVGLGGGKGLKNEERDVLEARDMQRLFTK